MEEKEMTNEMEEMAAKRFLRSMYALFRRFNATITITEKDVPLEDVETSEDGVNFHITVGNKSFDVVAEKLDFVGFHNLLRPIPQPK